MSRLVYGVGVYEKGEYTSSVNNRLTREYLTWVNMIRRCYCPKNLSRRPSYAGCSVDPRFHEFQRFMAWAENQVGAFADGFHLDKDLLMKGNRVYSPDVCIFLPQRINSALVSQAKARGKLPLGVRKSKFGRFFARGRFDNKREVCLGTYDTIDEAFSAYRLAKRQECRRLAEQFKDVIDPRAYAALLVYDVSIDD